MGYFFELLFQMAFTVALHGRLRPVLAKVFGDVLFIELVEAYNTQLHRALQQEANGDYYGDALFQYQLALAKLGGIKTIPKIVCAIYLTSIMQLSLIVPRYGRACLFVFLNIS